MFWVWLLADEDAPDGHNTRAIDADADGKDEVYEFGFVLNEGVNSTTALCQVV